MGRFDATVTPRDTAVKQDLGAFLRWVSDYRIVLRPGVEIVEGTLRPEVDPTDPDLRAALTAGGRIAHLAGEADGRVSCILIRPEKGRPLLLPKLLLFLLTVVTVLAAGAMLLGNDPFATRVAVLFFGIGVPLPTGVDLELLATGWSFAFPLLTVLGVHEAGHLMAARRHRIPAGWPWFVPMLPWVSLIGTLGAFIRLRGPIVRRRALLDVGASGPFAGFVVAVVFLAWGLTMSRAGLGQVEALTPYVIGFMGEPIWLGENVVAALATELFLPGEVRGPIVLHPVAFAGWLGLFLTALNLLPVGQLDGGHVMQALRPELQPSVARMSVFGLVALGFAWSGWWIWAFAVLLISRGRFQHPGVFSPEASIGVGRRVAGTLAILLFFATFTPLPISLAP